MKSAALNHGLRQFSDVNHVICDLKSNWSSVEAQTAKQLGLDKLQWVKSPDTISDEQHLSHQAITYIVNQL